MTNTFPAGAATGRVALDPSTPAHPCRGAGRASASPGAADSRAPPSQSPRRHHSSRATQARPRHQRGENLLGELGRLALQAEGRGAPGQGAPWSFYVGLFMWRSPKSRDDRIRRGQSSNGRVNPMSPSDW